MNNTQVDSKENNLISFVLPVELEVSKQAGIYSPLTHIDFGAVSVASKTAKNLTKRLFASVTNQSSFYFEQTSLDTGKTVDLYLTNSASIELRITVSFAHFKRFYVT